MNLTLHLIRKDLRQFRFAALFWAALIAGQIVCTRLLFSADAADLDWFNVVSMFTNLLYFLGMIVAYLLAGIIVLADAPAGSVAQWRTRPVSGGRLLRAKALVEFLFFGVLPVLLWLPWWLRDGFGANGVGLGAVSVLLLNFIPAVLGVALASVVDQIGRFMLLTMILMAALIVFALTSLVPRTIAPTLFGSRLLLDLAVGIVAAVTAAIVQYRTHRVGKSATVLVAGVTAILLIRAWWPVDLIVWYKDNVYAPPSIAGTVTGRIWNARMESRLNKDGLEEAYFWLGLDFDGVPASEFAADGLADVELSWPDGTTVRREKQPVWGGGGVKKYQILSQLLGFSPSRAADEHWDPETAAKNRAMREEFERRWPERHNGKPYHKAILRPGAQAEATIQVSVSPAIAAKMQLSPPACRVTVTLHTKRPMILAQAPFVAGMSVAEDGRARVVKFTRQSREIKDPRQVGVHYAGLLVTSRPIFSEQRSYFLIDRAHQALGGGLGQHMIQSVAPIGAWITAHVIDIDPPALWRTDRWVEVPDWQKDYAMVVEESRPAGTYRGQLATDRLEVTEPEANQP
jgi:hypothetical protein